MSRLFDAGSGGLWQTLKQRVRSEATAAQQQGPDISRLPPELQQQFDHARNAHLSNIVVLPGSRRKVAWICDKCPAGHPHKWFSTVNSRTSSRRTGCPFCAGKAVCPHNSLAANATEVAAQWSGGNPDRPEDYTAASSVNKLWHCDCCGHEWSARIQERTMGKRGCPNCYNVRRGNKRMRRPPVSDSQHAMALWDWKENQPAGLDPNKLTDRSHKVANWVCHNCPKGQAHKWTATVGNVCCGSGCPCCSGRKACICNSLQALHPEVAAEWDYTRNEGTPADYAAQSQGKVWWYNSQRGSFEARIKARTRPKKTPL